MVVGYLTPDNLQALASLVLFILASIPRQLVAILFGIAQDCLSSYCSHSARTLDMFAGLFGEDDESVQVENTSSSVSLPRPPSPRNSTNLSGLSNLGATCYLNALLQTLFFTPEFRGESETIVFELFVFLIHNIGSMSSCTVVVEFGHMDVMSLDMASMNIRIIIDTRYNVACLTMLCLLRFSCVLVYSAALDHQES